MVRFTSASSVLKGLSLSGIFYFVSFRIMALYTGSQLAALSINNNRKNPAYYTLALVIPIHLKVLP